MNHPTYHHKNVYIVHVIYIGDAINEVIVQAPIKKTTPASIAPRVRVGPLGSGSREVIEQLRHKFVGVSVVLCECVGVGASVWMRGCVMIS